MEWTDRLSYESVNFQACDVLFGIALGSKGMVWGLLHVLGTLGIDFGKIGMDRGYRNGTGASGMVWDQQIH